MKYIEVRDSDGKLDATIRFENGEIICDDSDLQEIIDGDWLLPKDPEERFNAIPWRFSNLSRYFFSEVKTK